MKELLEEEMKGKEEEKRKINFIMKIRFIIEDYSSHVYPNFAVISNDNTSRISHFGLVTKS